MSTRPRKRYKSYTADHSIPIPPVSLWRMNRTNKDVLGTSSVQPMEDHPAPDSASMLSDELDAFHKESLESMETNHFEDPALSEKEPYDIIQDEEFEQDDEDEVPNDVSSHEVDRPNADKPLYLGAQITLAASMILLVSYAMRHSLTGEALADLLVLIELHCLSPNLCQKNLKTFKDFFQMCKSPLECHYFCEKCFIYHGTVKLNECQNCKTPVKRNSTAYFLVIPIITQLTSLFSDDNLVKEIWAQKASLQRKANDTISDISDGKLYKEKFRKDGYFHGSTSKDDGQLHISLQINTDGVSLFHSSSFSIWPVYFIINELPPHLRFLRSNRIFGGLWFGYSKPDFRTFLKPFAESLHEIYHSGFATNTLRVKGILLNGVFDSPARCLFQNMVQFNGFNGCPYCYTPGQTVQTSERGHTLTYPFNMENEQGYGEPRTQSSFIRNAEEAEKNKTACSNGNVYGVKGLSWFAYLPNFDIVRGISIDYMHCVLLGVTKMFLNLWFDKSLRNEIFSIASKVKDVDQRLCSIKPPSFIARLPRTLSDMSHYKAAELKNFLLFYSLPCLFGILPADQFHHFSLLVFSTYILLKENITTQDLTKCRQMLLEFVLNLPVLYGNRYMTSNVHLLLHLTDKVELLGPLWSSSCFYFEDFNGQLRRLFHGTQNIESQIAFAVCVHQQLPKMAESLHHGSSEKDFFQKMFHKKRQATQERITDTIHVVGAYHSREMTDEEQHCVFMVVGDFSSTSFFKRLYINHQVIHCSHYRNAMRRDNSVVKYGNSSFGKVVIFVKVIPVGPPTAPKFLALVKTMEKVNNAHRDTSTDNGSSRTTSMSHMVQVTPQHGELKAIPVDQISDVCVTVNVNDKLCYVSVLPNKIEKE